MRSLLEEDSRSWGSKHEEVDKAFKEVSQILQDLSQIPVKKTAGAYGLDWHICP